MRLYNAIMDENSKPEQIRNLIAAGALENQNLRKWMAREIKNLVRSGDMKKLKGEVERHVFYRPPLSIAAQVGRADIVQLLLDAGEEIESNHFNVQCSSLSVAALWGHEAVVQLMLDASAGQKRIDLNEPLRFAVYGGHSNIVHMLLEAGADANAEPFSCSRDIGSMTEYENHWPCNFYPIEDWLRDISPLDLAIRTERRDIIDLLLDAGAHINGSDKYPDLTPLCLAARTGNLELMQHLIDRGADVNDKTSEYTPLIAATHEGCEDSVRFLLDHGADVNASTGEHTPLSAGAWYANEHFVPILRILLEAGADVNTEAGERPPLLAATMAGSLEGMQLLLEAGADVNRTTKIHTPLIAAAEKGSREGVQMLLDAGADVNKATQEYTPLIAAARGSNPDVIRLLLKAGADVNATAGTCTPLISAARFCKHTGCLKILLKAGADVNAVSDGRTAWEFALEANNILYAHILRAAGAKALATNEDNWRKSLKKKSPNVEELKIAIQNGCSAGEFRRLIKKGMLHKSYYDIHKGTYPPTLLFKAVQAGRLDIVRLLLKTGTGLDINTDDFGFGNPLTLAIKAGQINIVNFLLKSGADVNRISGCLNMDVPSETPLGTAARTGNTKLMQKLIDRGAMVNPSVEQLRTLHYTPLMSALREKCEESVRFLLVHGADVNAKAREHTALITAVKTEYSDGVRLLLEAGADVNGATEEYTPLIAAAWIGNTEIIRLLLEAGANVNVAVKWKTPLIVAALAGNTESIRLLLEAGANVNMRAVCVTPLIAASAYQVSSRTVQLLLAAGADVNAEACGCTPLMYALNNGNLFLARILRQAGAIDKPRCSLLRYRTAYTHSMLSFFLGTFPVIFSELEMMGKQVWEYI